MTSTSVNGTSRQKLEHTFDLDLTEARLNEALQNITLSVMYALDWWHTTTNVTQVEYQNIFSFSSRSRLIVPYAFSLLATLPFLFLGFRALRQNGEPAVDGGFIQPLVTTAGSLRLRDIAAEGSGRPHDVPESVKEARIRYGHLPAHGAEGLRGFGLEDEVVGLESNKVGGS